MPSAARSYNIEFGLSMLAYVILLPITMTLIERFPDALWRYAVAIVPVIPLIFALIAMLRFFSRIDELARKIHLDSCAAAAGITAIAAFAYGMLENVGLPCLNMVLVTPFTIAAWGITTFIATRRYQ
jgi:hypothetical protein